MQKVTLPLGMMILFACGSAESDPSEDPAAKVAEQAAAEAREAAAAKEAPPEPAAPMETTIRTLVDAQADYLDKLVQVEAIYVSHEAGVELTNVTLAASADEGAPTLLCTMVDGSAAEELEAGAELKVRGTLTKRDDDRVVLQDCSVAE